MIGASCALSISDIPFDGPVAGCIVGYIDGQYVINPSVKDMERSLINLTVAGTKDAINMVEAGAKEVSEDIMLDALMFGHEHIKKLCAFEEEVIAKCAKEKMEVKLYEINPEIKAYVDANAKEDLKTAVSIKQKLERYGKIDEIELSVAEHFEGLEYNSEKEKDKAVKQSQEYCTEIVAEEVRRLISVEKIRPDGRAVNEIRPLNSQVDLLPRVHGSALFTRGETQSLATVTLGTKMDMKETDEVLIQEDQQVVLHYNFPPFATGDAKSQRGVGRREIGHGNLALRALKPVIPVAPENPYAVRIVSDILESNGSSSMASVCGGCLALMDAGVKIKKPVAGVAMGLITDAERPNDRYAILTDILGDEDHLGDMDFKVTGTADGITATQMDIKVDGLSYDVLAKALEQARQGRLHIMGEMMKTISEPREDYKPFVPRIEQIRIASEFIGAVIGKGGETIQKIQKETGTVITITEEPLPGGGTEGVVDVASDNKEAMQKALDWIKGICAVPEVGAVYHGKVVSILEFGAFVEILPGKEGLLHVSEIAWTKTEKVEDVLSVGQEVDVKLLEVDAKTGKLRLSMRALTEKPEGYREPERRPRPERSDRRDDRRSDRGDRRSDRGDRRSDRGDDRGERSDRNERGERRFDRGADRNDRRSGRNFGPRNEAPAPAADDFKEPVEEIF